MNENHQVINLFNIIEIFKKFKIFEYHQFQNFSNIIDIRKQVFLSVDKMSECPLCKQRHHANNNYKFILKYSIWLKLICDPNSPKFGLVFTNAFTFRILFRVTVSHFVFVSLFASTKTALIHARQFIHNTISNVIIIQMFTYLSFQEIYKSSLGLDWNI